MKVQYIISGCAEIEYGPIYEYGPIWRTGWLRCNPMINRDPPAKFDRSWEPVLFRFDKAVSGWMAA